MQTFLEIARQKDRTKGLTNYYNALLTGSEVGIHVSVSLETKGLSQIHGYALNIPAVVNTKKT